MPAPSHSLRSSPLPNNPTSPNMIADDSHFVHRSPTEKTIIKRKPVPQMTSSSSTGELASPPSHTPAGPAVASIVRRQEGKIASSAMKIPQKMAPPPRVVTEDIRAPTPTDHLSRAYPALPPRRPASSQEERVCNTGWGRTGLDSAAPTPTLESTDRAGRENFGEDFALTDSSQPPPPRARTRTLSSTATRSAANADRHASTASPSPTPLPTAIRRVPPPSLPPSTAPHPLHSRSSSTSSASSASLYSTATSASAPQTGSGEDTTAVDSGDEADEPSVRATLKMKNGFAKLSGRRNITALRAGLESVAGITGKASETDRGGLAGITKGGGHDKGGSSEGLFAGFRRGATSESSRPSTPTHSPSSLNPFTSSRLASTNPSRRPVPPPPNMPASRPPLQSAPTPATSAAGPGADEAPANHPLRAKVASLEQELAEHRKRAAERTKEVEASHLSLLSTLQTTSSAHFRTTRLLLYHKASLEAQVAALGGRPVTKSLLAGDHSEGPEVERAVEVARRDAIGSWESGQESVSGEEGESKEGGSGEVRRRRDLEARLRASLKLLSDSTDRADVVDSDVRNRLGRLEEATKGNSSEEIPAGPVLPTSVDVGSVQHDGGSRLPASEPAQPSLPQLILTTTTTTTTVTVPITSPPLHHTTAPFDGPATTTGQSLSKLSEVSSDFTSSFGEEMFRALSTF